MLTPDQLPAFYPDLRDERVDSAIALVHSRFSTNTFPSWPLAHPYRFIAHNGEINTIRGNRNWMQAREALLRSPNCPGQHPAGLPDLHARRLRLGELRRGAGAAAPGRAEPAARGAHDDPRGVGERPGDGPGQAGLLPLPRQPDGAVGRSGVAWPSPTATIVGAVLDRNGLRPGRWWQHRRRAGGARLSEAGVLDLDPADVVAKGRLQPGRMFLVDTAAGRIVHDDEIKSELAAAAAVRRVAARRADRPGRPAGPRAHRLHARLGAAAASRPSATPRRS